MRHIQYTESQNNVIGVFKEFLDGDEQVFMLKGAAGTGKTTLVTEFLKIIEGQKREFGLMAPTGRAAYIIGSKTGKQAYTIHKSIYSLTKLKSPIQNNEEEDHGSLHLRFGLKGNNDSLKAVYIVDESSMISDSNSENEAFSFGSGCLLTDLFEFAGGRKIVLVGDYAQLPPVGMNSSPALDKEYIENKFCCRVKEYMLREVMLENRCAEQARKICGISTSHTVVLLDYDTNGDVENPSKPLSHASLIKRYRVMQ